MNTSDFAIPHKAGVIPYIVVDGKVEMLFMKPSDAKYGGPKFQIAKGGIDAGENVVAAALREGAEELGLVQTNIKRIRKLVTKKLTGLDETYILTVYAAEVRSKTAFIQPHYETADTMWMTVDEFRVHGRLTQLSIVQLLT